MKRNKPLGVLFDYGDTILQINTPDWIPASGKLLEYAENPTGLSAEALQAMADRINHEFEPRRNESMIEQDVMTFYRLLFDTAGISLSIGFDEAARIGWQAAYHLTPEDGVREMLDTLNNHGIKTGIISNSAFPGTILMEELGKHGLADSFSFAVVSADYGIRKPHPRIFEIAARKMGLEPKDIWFAGDKPQYDIIGAAGAGMFPVWYNTDGETYDHGCDCLEVKTWQEFVSIIESF
jgi:putative hydrolase of the HAD superfamily